MNLDKVFVFDIETVGLLPELKSADDLHVLSVGWINTAGEIQVKSTKDPQDIQKLLSDPNNTLVGHNIIEYDVPALKIMYPEIEVKASLIDSLPLSWYLYDGRLKHGLEVWGDEFGIKKPEIKDWNNLSFEDYKFRCESDVRINFTLWLKQLEKLRKIYSDNPEQIPKLIFLLNWIMECSYMQQVQKILVDVKKLEETIAYFMKLKLEKLEELKKAMPKIPITKVMSFPKKGLYKKDGSLSVAGEKYLSICQQAGLGLDYEGDIEVTTGYEEANPNSVPQKKAWLYSLKWKPITFKHNRDKKTNEVSVAEQIMTEEKELCPSVLALKEVEPAIEHLDGLTVLTHRIGLLNGFKKEMDENNMISQSIAGLAVSMRWQHRTIVNLPRFTGKGDIRDGKWIRECLIAGPGKKIVQSDLSGIESRTSDHYTFHINQDRIRKTQMPFFDPHCEIAVASNLMSRDEEIFFVFKSAVKENPALKVETFSEIYQPTQEVYRLLSLPEEEQKEIISRLKVQRSKGKTCNYASLYLVGSQTLARNLDITKKEAQKLIDAYWDVNFAVKKVSETFIMKEVDGETWTYNPISKFWYYVRNPRNIFSVINQSSAVYCFNMWIYNCTKKGIWPVSQSHDDGMWIVDEDKAGETVQTIEEAMDKVNEILNLNVKLECDTQIGNNLAETH